MIIVEDGAFSKTIERHTGSSMNHAAIVLYDKDEVYVYESSPPRVKRTAWERWEAETAKYKRQYPKSMVYCLYPNPPWSSLELQRMKTYADSQMGRPYMVRGYLRDEEVKGIHCSQYVGNILAQTGRIQSANYKESPFTLYEKMRQLENGTPSAERQYSTLPPHTNE